MRGPPCAGPLAVHLQYILRLCTTTTTTTTSTTMYYYLLLLSLLLVVVILKTYMICIYIYIHTYVLYTHICVCRPRGAPPAAGAPRVALLGLVGVPLAEEARGELLGGPAQKTIN